MTLNSAHPEVGPELKPLEIGSPAARALYDLWSGHYLISVEEPDVDDRITTAVTISSHLAVRAGVRVRLSADDELFDRAVAGVTEQVPANLVRLPTGFVPGPDGPEGPQLWRPWESPNNGLFVTSNEMPSLFSYTIRVVLTSQPFERFNFPARRVVVSGEAPQGEHSVSTNRGLPGDIPLDIVIAGAP